jgi:hypothetical protein
MEAHKTKSITQIEDRMETLSPDSFRYKILDSAKNFKTSWMELGQYLVGVHKDKLFRDWGYLTFEAYCAKEIGIRQNTAVKLLKSYSFLEREEPEYLKYQFSEESKPSQIPSYEAVNALRLVKDGERVTGKEYKDLRDDVLEKAKEEGEVKKKIKYILKSNPSITSTGNEADKKMELAKRLILNMNNVKARMNELVFPNKIIKQVDGLIDLLTDYSK